ncbi:hypothetical protein AOLI_G00302370 [Acnodon oligacanthus]
MELWDRLLTKVNFTQDSCSNVMVQHHVFREWARHQDDTGLKIAAGKWGRNTPEKARGRCRVAPRPEKFPASLRLRLGWTVEDDTADAVRHSQTAADGGRGAHSCILRTPSCARPGTKNTRTCQIVFSRWNAGDQMRRKGKTANCTKLGITLASRRKNKEFVVWNFRLILLWWLSGSPLHCLQGERGRRRAPFAIRFYGKAGDAGA